ncbi:unnamed protein product [Linum tenue]|uniref:anthocyanidin 3-O-glucosyltransferase n=1 Tax=Linum tenue TaxID=586396 RepID=A0AAV0KXF2_9ROSI|nr:unnamed protein product [Linum tenue]
MTELAWGLELSEQRFVLVARFPSDRYLPEGFVERTKGRGVVVASWAPQIAVLGHVATGGFLSHCGWNSTLESVSSGVPMIAWPLYAEQRMNATILEEEVGVAVKVAAAAAVVGREEIERVVRLVMEGEKGKEMREKARLLKESAAEALSVGGGGSWASLAKVAERWKK